MDGRGGIYRGWGKEENMGEEWEKSVGGGERIGKGNGLEGRGICVDWGRMGFGV